jgi:hypothetical protein
MANKFQFTTTLPRHRYSLADYPNLDPDAVGKVIPIGYGTLTGLPPTKLDDTFIYRTQWKILDQALAEITAMHSATTATMIKDVDYEEDLANGGFYLLKAAHLTPSTTYRFAIEADYGVSASNYMSLGRNNGAYADGVAYSINGAGTWSGDALGNDLLFEIYGKTALGATEILIYDNSATDATEDIGLKDSSLRTKVGQSFKTSAADVFITRIVVYGTVHGTLTDKNIRATLYNNTLDQVGVPSQWVSTDDGLIEIGFYPQNEDETLRCDVKAPGTELNKAATILPDVITSIMGRATSHLDSTELANLAADRDQVLAIYLSEVIQFGDFVAKLQAGQIWQLIPLQDGNWGTVVPETGEPANLLTLRDHDFLSFKMEYDSSIIKEAVTVFYDQDEADSTIYPGIQVTSQVARFFYLNETELTVETFLKVAADADALADSYIARYEVPVIKATFEIHGKGIELLPFRDKVKIYRTRAPYTGGTMNGVLMRIVSLTKNPEDNVVTITAAIWGNAAT